MRTKLDQLDELAFVIMLLLGIAFMAAMFGDVGNKYRDNLRKRVQEARNQIQKEYVNNQLQNKATASPKTADALQHDLP